MNEGILSKLPTWRKLMVVFGLALVFTAVFYFIGALTARFIYGVSMSASELTADLQNPQVVNALKIIQAVGAGLGTFIATSLVSAWLFGKKIFAYLQGDSSFSFQQFLTTIMLFFTAIPAVNFIVEWNQHLDLPEWLNPVEDWMRTNEEEAERITRAFVNVTSWQALAVNLIVVALLPAFGEEFLFRGIIQRLFVEGFRNYHVAIWASAALFSFIHFQFFGFFPRLLLGALFGYMLVWTKSIWLPVIAHFVNNALAVLFSFLVFNDYISLEPDTIGTHEGEQSIVALSVILTSFLIYHLYSIRNLSKNNEPEDTQIPHP